MYNWKKYNIKKNALAKKFEIHNNKYNFNFIEQSYYNHTRDLFTLSILNLSQYSKAKKTIVLDFGSNLAAISNIKNKIETKNIEFLIYNPDFDNKKRKNLFKNVHYKILTDLKKIKKVDLLNFGSSIQYLDDYKKIFKSIKFSKNSIILISASPFTLKKTYFSAQKNHKNLIQKINNFNSFVKFFKKNRYSLVFKSAMNTKLASINKLKSKTLFLNLLFKKN